jgi:hypothetical protein
MRRAAGELVHLSIAGAVQGLWNMSGPTAAIQLLDLDPSTSFLTVRWLDGEYEVRPGHPHPYGTGMKYYEWSALQKANKHFPQVHSIKLGGPEKGGFGFPGEGIGSAVTNSHPDFRGLFSNALAVLRRTHPGLPIHLKDTIPAWLVRDLVNSDPYLQAHFEDISRREIDRDLEDKHTANLRAGKVSKLHTLDGVVKEHKLEDPAVEFDDFLKSIRLSRRYGMLSVLNSSDLGISEDLPIHMPKLYQRLEKQFAFKHQLQCLLALIQ